MTRQPAALVIGRYQLFEPIGAGGMATVFLGRQCGNAGFTRPVAIKRLHPQLASDPDVATLFLDEARLAARVRHTNVVQTLDVVREGREVLIVMELVDGVTLSALARSEPRLELGVISAIVCGALRGLHAAHIAVDGAGSPLGIIHRDVSPQNILVGVDGVTRVLDFGVAKANGQAHATRPGDVRGKLAYMAPEHLRGGATPRSDVYAVGVILWELLAGRRLHTGDAEAALIGQVLFGEIPPLPTERTLPPGLEELLLRTLSRDVSARPSNALQMAEALELLVPPASPTALGLLVTLRGAERTELLHRAILDAELEPALPSISLGGQPDTRLQPVTELQPLETALTQPVSCPPVHAIHANPTMVSPGARAAQCPPRTSGAAAGLLAPAAGQAISVWAPPTLLARAPHPAHLTTPSTSGYWNAGPWSPVAMQAHWLPTHPHLGQGVDASMSLAPWKQSSHVALNMAFLTCMAAFHALYSLGWLLSPSAPGSVWGFFLTAWILIGSVWTVANVYGLATRAPWARGSAEIYAIVAIFTVFGTPYGVYGAISLRLPSVRAALAGRPTASQPMYPPAGLR